MPIFNIRNLEQIKLQHPQLGEALEDFLDGLTNVTNQVNADPRAEPLAPPRLSQLNVTAAQGIFDVQILDNSPVNRGITYFLEYSTTPSFSAPIQVFLGPARNWRGNLGNQLLYWRAYSQYPTSPPSAMVYYGTQQSPIPTIGGGANTGPNIQASAGSGTAPTNGTSGGSGWGLLPRREQI